jgi:hydroxymethylpyrimidine pyrophosphatase-like HAD family hydrolase
MNLYNFRFSDTQLGLIRKSLESRKEHINHLIEIFSKKADKDPGSRFMVEEYEIERKQVITLLEELDPNTY